MPSLMYEKPDGTIGIWGSALANTNQLRRAAANAARLRLPRQLDWRLDTVLDSEGFHIIGLDDIDNDLATEPVARCHAMIKFAYSANPFEMHLDFRLRDFVHFQAAGAPDNDTMLGKTGGKSVTGLTIGDLDADDNTPMSTEDVIRASRISRSRDR